MCGVLGYHSFKATFEDYKKFMRLFEESSIRGLHAFGASMGNGNKLHTEKFIDKSKFVEFVRDSWSAREGEELFVLAHCRYSTSGDWETIENNQPIVVGDNILVFNGVIRMTTKEEYEKEFGRKYKTDNDGEILLECSTRHDVLLDNLEGFYNIVDDERVSFAGILFHNGIAWAERNERRPLYSCSENGSNWIASTNDVFERSGFKNQKIIPVMTRVIL